MTKRSPQEALEYCLSLIDIPQVYRRFGYRTSWGVYKWRAAGIPAVQVLPLVNEVRKAGGEITCHELRPDVFPKGA